MVQAQLPHHGSGYIFRLGYYNHLQAFFYKLSIGIAQKVVCGGEEEKVFFERLLFPFTLLNGDHRYLLFLLLISLF